MFQRRNFNHFNFWWIINNNKPEWIFNKHALNHIAIAAARFNQFIVSKLVEGAVDALARHGADPDEITIAEFAEEIIKLTGTTQKVIYKPLPVDDPKQRQPDIHMATVHLDWTPKTNLKDGLIKAIKYFDQLLSI